MASSRRILFLLAVSLASGQYGDEYGHHDDRLENGNNYLSKGMDGTGTKVSVSESYKTYKADVSKCEPIAVKFCQGIQYNTTQFPNMLHHDSQRIAGAEVEQFAPLARVNCSPSLRFFLCSVYIPFCSPMQILPCRSLCMEAKNGCEELMSKFGVPWPENLNCDKFPVEQPCVVYNDTGADATGDKSVPAVIHGSNGWELDMGIKTSDGKTPNDEVYVRKILSEVDETLRQQPDLQFRNNQGDHPGRSPDLRSKAAFACIANYSVRHSRYHFQVGNETVNQCGLPCRKMFFSEYEREVIRIWIVVWSAACAVSTAFTFLTFLTDRSRFMYPERPIIFLSMCYFGISVSYIIGFFLHDRVACTVDSLEKFRIAKTQLTLHSPNAAEDTKSYLMGQIRRMVEPVVTMGSESEGCGAMAVLYYFFTLAAAAWWVMLTFAWFLAAAFKWSPEAIESSSHFFHLAVWLFASVMSIVVLSTKNIDGDPLSGICGVGNFSPTALQWFVVTPLAVCLFVGVCFFATGFLALYRIRNIVKHDETAEIERLEKFMIKISVFSVFYNVPAIISLACYLYEVISMKTWMVTWYEQVCREDLSVPCPSANPGVAVQPGPEFAVFMIKYLMVLVVGISSGFWIWTPKTLASWGSFSTKCLSTKSQAAAAQGSAGQQPRGATTPMQMQSLGNMPNVPGTVPRYGYGDGTGNPPVGKGGTMNGTDLHYYHRVQSGGDASTALLPSAAGLHPGLPTPSTSSTFNPAFYPPPNSRTPLGGVSYNNQGQMVPLYRA